MALEASPRLRPLPARPAGARLGAAHGFPPSHGAGFYRMIVYKR